MSFDYMTPNKQKDQKSNSSIGNYAIAEASGTQIWLEPNRYYDVDRLNAKVNETVTLEKVLLVNDQEGLSIGKPYVKDASIQLKVLAHKRGKKILVYKMRPKKKTRRKNGHRQELTRVMVTAISNGLKTKKIASSSKSTAKKAPSEAKDSKVSNKSD